MRNLKKVLSLTLIIFALVSVFTLSQARTIVKPPIPRNMVNVLPENVLVENKLISEEVVEDEEDEIEDEEDHDEEDYEGGFFVDDEEDDSEFYYDDEDSDYDDYADDYYYDDDAFGEVASYEYLSLTLIFSSIFMTVALLIFASYMKTSGEEKYTEKVHLSYAVTLMVLFLALIFVIVIMQTRIFDVYWNYSDKASLTVFEVCVLIAMTTTLISSVFNKNPSTITLSAFVLGSLAALIYDKVADCLSDYSLTHVLFVILISSVLSNVLLLPMYLGAKRKKKPMTIDELDEIFEDDGEKAEEEPKEEKKKESKKSKKE
ncbi:MAG: hypothetical protein IKN74_01900 [Clostridia bacterium]|nr:hypothetical protein [Clostridia bacterium]